ncbi:alpha/beta hydrolase [Halostreptopolyspora alba]|uniref:Alpha/beta hydrolase n=1 Tax=Halostreptopolyspora alba TaxID=2487137 RepID=A0A3N0EHN7_9ACTN|nr:alpha/beta hydrolase [Nocardiopsaceae bacterium YIM 96095]
MPFRHPPVRTAGVLAAAGALTLATACGDTDGATPTDTEISGEEHSVEFEVGNETRYGTLTLPEDADEPVPGALIISGSGPTDRDGNSPLRPDANTNRNFAEVLSEAGIASLRYDKLGSGETGMAGRDEDDRVRYEDFENGVVAAYGKLAGEPGVDPDRLLVLGHSEGALFALRTPRVVQDSPPIGLLLAAPPGERYLDTIDRQVTEQVRKAESAGEFDAERATQVLSDTRYGISRIRADEPLPEDLSPELEGLFEPRVAPFLRRIDDMDPQRLADDLPEDTETLVLWGTADSQIPGRDIERLMGGLDDGTRVDIEDADHVFREYEGTPGAAVLDSERPFSDEVAPAVREFLDTVV